MWFRSIFLKTLRDCRIPIAGWGLGIGVMTPLIVAIVPTLLSDAQSRAAIEGLLRNPVIRIFGEPAEVLTPGGYATWRLAIILPLVGIWALLAGSRTLRGEEESGSLDLLLSLPRSRLHVAAAKLAALAVAVGLIGMLIGLMAFAGGLMAHAQIPLRAALGFGLNTALLAGVYGGCAVLASQFTTGRRTAAGVSGALLGLSMMMTSAGRAVPGAEWVGRLSPVYYFERSKPLVPSVGTDARAMAVLAVLSLLLTATGMVLFLRRDIGGRIALHAGSPDELRTSATTIPIPGGWRFRSVLAQSAASMIATVTTWSVALAVYTCGMTAIVQQAQRSLLELIDNVARQNPMYAALIARFTGGRDAAINARALGAIFTLIAVVVSAFAVTLASRWAADEEEGQLDLVLATPCSRRHLILARFAAAMTGLIAVAATIFASAAVTASGLGFALDRSRLAEAAGGMVPVAIVVAAIGYLLAGWLRSSSVTGTLTALLLASLVVTLLGPLFKWPPIVMQLSLFEQYGTPMVDGLHPWRVAGLLAAAVLALAVATVRFERKDLVR